MKTRFGFLLVFSAFFLFGIGVADSVPSKDNPQEEKKAEKKDTTSYTQINWLKYDKGLELAKKEGKKLFVEFTAKWCGWCKKMHATTFLDPEVVNLMGQNYVAVSVDGDSRDSLNIDGWITTERALARQYKVSSYPTYWFLTPEAEPIAPVKGYRTNTDLSNILDYLKDDTYKTISFKDFLDDKQKK